MNKTKLNYSVVFKDTNTNTETPKNFALKQSILNGALSEKVNGMQSPQQTSVMEPVAHQ